MPHFLGAVLARLRATLVVESSLVLGAQAFLALFPLVLVVYAVSPPKVAQGLLDTLRDRLGLSGNTAEAVDLVANRDATRGTLSVLGFILVIGSATAFTRALQRVYERAWDLPKLGLRGLWRGLAWLVGLLIYLTVITIVVQGGHSLHLGAVFGGVIGLALWWWTPFLLLGGRVRWRALAPHALLTGLAELIASAVSAGYMPRTIRQNESRYGPIGVVFAVESWLVVICGIIVVSAALGAALARDTGRVGAYVRGTPDPDAWRRRPDPAPSATPLPGRLGSILGKSAPRSGVSP